MSLPRIVQMVESFDKVGGPPALVRLLINSPLASQYEFKVVSYTIKGFNPQAVLKMRNELNSLKPDLVHIHGLKADGFHAVLAARLACVKRILITVHGSTADAITSYQKPIMRIRRWFVSNFLETGSLLLADAVYCVCENMKSNPRIRRYAGSRLKNTIYNGVSSELSNSHDSDKRTLFGFDKSDVIAIYTGRIARDKGLEVLASSLNQIKEKHIMPGNFKILLVGNGPEFSHIQNIFLPFIKSGQVVMTGRRDDIPILNMNADIFVFPSFHENLSFSLLEAMVAKLPVIATSVGGNKEIVIDGITGIVVPPHDANSLAIAMLRLVKNKQLRVSMGKAGRNRILKVFTSEKTFKQTGSLYASIMKK